MKKNRLRELLNEGKPTIGTHVVTTSPEIVESSATPAPLITLSSADSMPSGASPPWITSPAPWSSSPTCPP